ncbi:thioesterase family protein [Rhodococcus sp. NPDC060086]|uniref:thioesterase family protein n=1 Tax=Rhodococcus sp. NPDC060086 TaxID=3347055 RepID=UPI00365D3887
MKDAITVGDIEIFRYVVRDDKMVPNLYVESADYRIMPRVFATGFMVGLLEWCAIIALRRVLDEGEGSLGTLVDIRHSTPTPAGAELTVTAVCTKVEPPYYEWDVTAVDGEGDIAASGRHGRNIIITERFQRRVDAKADRLAGRSTV